MLIANLSILVLFLDLLRPIDAKIFLKLGSVTSTEFTASAKSLASIVSLPFCIAIYLAAKKMVLIYFLMLSIFCLNLDISSQ